jgi:hypothetical protein
MTDKAQSIELTKKGFEFVTKTLSDEIAGTFGKFALIAEKGTVVFLLAAGASFMILGVTLSYKSESLLDREFEYLLQSQLDSHRSQLDHQTPMGTNSGQASEPINNEQKNASEPKVAISLIPSVLLLLSGTTLMLGGAATSLISYKWRLESCHLDQPYRTELLREEARLKSATIDAVSKTGQLQSPKPVHDEKP